MAPSKKVHKLSVIFVFLRRANTLLSRFIRGFFKAMSLWLGERHSEALGLKAFYFLYKSLSGLAAMGMHILVSSS